ncbi:tetratricopeptide (TPR) repeat protein [Duganella sp. 1411]|uniref:tetratricopeptide repeat protein n=1 Tax=Duganella sp. 1411 TaxID=2806572 RepID=UPI001AEAF4DB|nr:tetratricopeptide repeat protein [Duganella sp. 1411]MBP1203262.1 tetratricopeptide (TPR) repeat protein [Duganella sp. 1411]
MTSELIFSQRLGLSDDADERAIRRAYARELKLIDQEADPAGFQYLREAYDAALYWVRHKDEFEEHIALEELEAVTVEAPAQPPLSPPGPAEHRHADPAPASPQEQALEIDHDALAEAVFADFLRRASAIADERPVTPDAPWQRELRASLDDPRLINITAREMFERRVADLLTTGWRPGHEALLVAAVKVFDWAGDRRRVFSLGRSGAMLDAAIDERATFDLQPDAQREQQRQLIERLRDPKPPGTRELVRNSATLETLIARFPTWLALITSVDNIVQWRERNNTLPKWRRKLTYTGLRKPAEPSYEHQEKSGFNWTWLIILGFISLIRFLAHDGGAGQAPSYAPDEVTKYFNRGNEQLKNGDAQGAVDSFSRVLELKPNDAHAYGNRAAAYLNSDKDQLAAKDFDKLAALDPSSPLLYRGRGMLALKAGRNEEAVAAFTKALELEPHHTFALTRRANAYERLGDSQKALADIDEVLRLDKNSGPVPYILRIRIYKKQGDNDKALAQLEPMLAANPASAFAYISAAELQIQLHDHAKAMALLDRGVVAAPEAEIYLYRAQLRPRSDKEGRQRDIDSGLALDPHGVYAHRLRAELEFDNGKPAAAIATLTKIINDNKATGDLALALIDRGAYHLKMASLPLAQTDFEGARKTAKAPIELNNIAWELARRNIALPTALSIATEAVDKQPGQATFIDSKAFVLLRLGRYSEAIGQYDAALKLAPKLPAALYGRGIAKWRAGQLAAGDADLKAARAAKPDIADEFARMGVRR